MLRFNHYFVKTGFIHEVLSELDSITKDELDSIDDSGNTLLHAASGRVERPSSLLIDNLISKGIDVNARNDNGDSPLHVVRSVMAAEALMLRGANINAMNRHHFTPVNVLIRTGMGRAGLEEVEAVVFKLIDLGADVTSPVPGGETPLGFAKRNPGTMRKLQIKLQGGMLKDVFNPVVSLRERSFAW